MIIPTRPSPIDYVAAGQWAGVPLTAWATPPGGDEQAAIVDGAVTLTYGDLRIRVDRLAGTLAARGIEPGDVVTVELPNWWEASVAMHATLRAHAVVNPVVPIYRDAELGFIIDQAGSGAVVVPHVFRGYDYVAMLERLLAGRSHPPLVVVVRPTGPLPDGFVSFDELADGAATFDGPAPSASDVCLLLYTSGTTADPKGVIHVHDTLHYENRSIAELFELDVSDTVFMPSPVTHITGFLYGILMPPMLGSTVVFQDIWDAAAARDLIERHECRFTMAATPFLQGLVDVYAAAGERCSLRSFPCGGADVPPELVPERARAVLGTAVIRVYGSSEFPTFSCSAPDDPERVAAETDGRPIGPVEFRIEEGELVVRGPELFLGYLDASLNEAAFTDDGWFRTGDLALGTDGAVTITGRKKDIIIRGGENISAKEIEDHLYSHPKVREVAVVAMPDPGMGEKASAVVVPEGDTPPTLAELCAHLEAARIAKQKFPERLEIVDELPKTPSGKVQKYVLRDRVRDALTPTT